MRFEPYLMAGLVLLAGCNDRVGKDADRGADAVPAAASTAASGISSGPPRSVRMLIDAGVVTPEGRLADRRYSGRFVIRTAAPGEQAVASATVGGACLIARVPTGKPPCRFDADCNSRYDGLKSATGYAYCLGNGSSDVPAGQCWIKPNKDYCLKGVGEGSHKTPAVSPVEVANFARDRYRTTDVAWKVIGCLNGPDYNGRKPCELRGTAEAANSQVMYDEGPELR